MVARSSLSAAWAGTSPWSTASANPTPRQQVHRGEPPATYRGGHLGHARRALDSAPSAGPRAASPGVPRSATDRPLREVRPGPTDCSPKPRRPPARTARVPTKPKWRPPSAISVSSTSCTTSWGPPPPLSATPKRWRPPTHAGPTFWPFTRRSKATSRGRSPHSTGFLHWNPATSRHEPAAATPCSNSTASTTPSATTRESWNSSRTTPPPGFGLGRIDYERGEFERAAKRFETALRGQPDGSAIHHHVGLALRRLGRRDEAALHLERNQHVRVGFPDPLFAALQRLNASREAPLQARHGRNAPRRRSNRAERLWRRARGPARRPRHLVQRRHGADRARPQGGGRRAHAPRGLHRRQLPRTALQPGPDPGRAGRPGGRRTPLPSHGRDRSRRPRGAGSGTPTY